jgi:aminopeptidase-like protein
MRSKYGEYPEYHTSLDNLDLITPSGLEGGYMALRRCLEVIEADRTYRTTVLCEPQMGARGLYSTLGGKSIDEAVRRRMNILAYADGKHSLIDLAEQINEPVWTLIPCIEELLSHQLLVNSN